MVFFESHNKLDFLGFLNSKLVRTQRKHFWMYRKSMNLNGISIHLKRREGVSIGFRRPRIPRFFILSKKKNNCREAKQEK